MLRARPVISFVVAAVVLAGSAVAGWWLADPDPGPTLSQLKRRYARPATVPFPTENAYSDAKSRLGKQLFFDQRLSGKNNVSCAGCHMPARGWGDGKPLAEGPTGQPQDRHTPTLWNAAWGRTFFWDGRSPSLEDQATRPVLSQGEMNQPMPSLLAELDGVAGYRDAFAEAFPADPRITEANLAKAIATYERTLVQAITPFDSWISGDTDAISEAAKRGFMLFNGKANCAECHSGWNFTQGAFHDIGLPATDDKGRGPVLGVEAANHAFKTPTLRDVERRAPYMHDGSVPTLEAAIAHYEDGFIRRETLSADMRAIDLTAREKDDLLAFLKTLTTPPSQRGVTRPELPE